MLQHQLSVGLILIIVSLIKQSSCDCQRTYRTTCDRLSDVLKIDLSVYPDTSKWRELVIGSEGDQNYNSLNFMLFPFHLFNKLSVLTINGQINKLVKSPGIRCSYKMSLHTIIMYGNHIKYLEGNSFPSLTLKKLSLSGNQIEVIAKGVFSFSTIEYLDLSENSIESIEKPSLPRGLKILEIGNNKLTHIDDEAFPDSLEELNLDHNNFRHLQEGVLRNLKNLKELSLSYNKFTVLPPLDLLKNIKILDFSHNQIDNIVQDAIAPIKNLLFLDLSYNKIANSYFLHFLGTPRSTNKKTTIQVAFNRLTELPFKEMNSSINGYVLYLYGNPWDCNHLKDHAKILINVRSECDKKISSNGTIPYCITFDTYDQTWGLEEILQRYFQAISDAKNPPGCNLIGSKSDVLYPFQMGCVG